MKCIGLHRTWVSNWKTARTVSRRKSYLTYLGAYLFRAYGLSVVKLEAPNDETRTILFCLTRTDHYGCTFKSNKTTLIVTPPANCSTSVSFHRTKRVIGLLTIIPFILGFYFSRMYKRIAHLFNVK